MDNVKAAMAKGLKAIAITDHGPRHFRIGVSLKSLNIMRREIDEINKRYNNIRVLMGVEANLIGQDGSIDVPSEFLPMFDILLMGFHKEVYPASWRQFTGFFLPNIMMGFGAERSQELIETNTQAYINAMERYPISIITHPGANISVDTKRLAAAAAAYGVYLEINSSHGFMTAEYVKIAVEQGAKFVVSSDAHSPEMVGDFERAKHIVAQAGLKAIDIINAV